MRMRIRTVKPSFMQHESLQDLEVDHPGKYIMLTFQSLWMLSDNKGRFEYKPRLMKLEILPFIPFDLQETLDILEERGYFFTYEVKGKRYGKIPTFLEHQRITGREATKEGDKYPDPLPAETPGVSGGNKPETPRKQTGNTTETTRITGKGNGRGIGREEEAEKEMTDVDAFEIPELDLSFEKEILADFGFNEQVNYDKFRTVAAFIQVQKNLGRLDYFKEQYRNYHLYKNSAAERKHNFTSFFGNQSNAFQDGRWDEANWQLMLNDFQRKSEPTKTSKIEHNMTAVEEANQILAKMKGEHQHA